jgi:hypothetical protein
MCTAKAMLEGCICKEAITGTSRPSKREVCRFAGHLPDQDENKEEHRVRVGKNGGTRSVGSQRITIAKAAEPG